MKHKVYGAIVEAVRVGRLAEPFSAADFRRACQGLGEGTYKAFLWKHKVGNSGGESELFMQVSRGRFRCLRPFRYGLE